MILYVCVFIHVYKFINFLHSFILCMIISIFQMQLHQKLISTHSGSSTMGLYTT